MAKLEGPLRFGCIRGAQRLLLWSGDGSLSARLQIVADAERAAVWIRGAVVAYHLAAAARSGNFSGVPGGNQTAAGPLDGGARRGFVRRPSDSRGVGGLYHGFDGCPGDSVHARRVSRLFPIPGTKRRRALLHGVRIRRRPSDAFEGNSRDASVAAGRLRSDARSPSRGPAKLEAIYLHPAVFCGGGSLPVSSHPPFRGEYRSGAWRESLGCAPGRSVGPGCVSP